VAITTRDGLIAALAASQRKSIIKVPATAGKGAGFFHSYWTAPGFPGAGAAAGSVNGAICTDATAGAIPFTNPTAPVLTYLGRMSLGASLGAYFELYDRLWHNSALVGNVTTLQSFTQPALTRWTTGEGVELWMEVYSAVAHTAQTVTVLYTNSAGTSGRSTTFAFPASPVVGQMQPIPLAAGDTGVRSVQSVQFGATSGQAGNWGLVLMKPHVEISIPNSNMGVTQGPFDLALPQVADDACLTYACLLPGTVAPIINGAIDLAQG
jgi:hypothetical protein